MVGRCAPSPLWVRQGCRICVSPVVVETGVHTLRVPELASVGRFGKRLWWCDRTCLRSLRSQGMDGAGCFWIRRIIRERLSEMGAPDRLSSRPAATVRCLSLNRLRFSGGDKPLLRLASLGVKEGVPAQRGGKRPILTKFVRLRRNLFPDFGKSRD